MQKYQNLRKKYGKSFSCGWNTNKGTIIACTMKGTNGYVDIFALQIDSTITHRLMSFPKHHFTVEKVLNNVPWQWVFPSKMIDWEAYNRSVPLANNYDGVLTVEYGPNWVIPPSLWIKYDDCLVIFERGIMDKHMMNARTNLWHIVHMLIFSMFCIIAVISYYRCTCKCKRKILNSKYLSSPSIVYTKVELDSQMENAFVATASTILDIV